MAWRKGLSALLMFVAVSPAWGAAEPVGSVTSTNAATVRDMKLTAGSTVFNGDVISVSEHGSAQIALSSGAQAEILSKSSVRLTKLADTIQISVDRGQASFHSSGNKKISALVADATVRPAGSADTSAIIQSLSGTHAIIAAEKGSLLVTTARDGKTYTVNEGEAADLSAMADPAQGGTPPPAGKSAPGMAGLSGHMVFWTVVIVGAAAAVTAYLVSRSENTPSTQQLQNEISPAKLN
jgi:ferric-dicitrate binding protein FerR (iron transport regulator)